MDPSNIDPSIVAGNSLFDTILLLIACITVPSVFAISFAKSVQVRQPRRYAAYLKVNLTWMRKTTLVNRARWRTP